MGKGSAQKGTGVKGAGVRGKFTRRGRGPMVDEEKKEKQVQKNRREIFCKRVDRGRKKKKKTSGGERGGPVPKKIHRSRERDRPSSKQKNTNWRESRKKKGADIQKRKPDHIEKKSPAYLRKSS